MPNASADLLERARTFAKETLRPQAAEFDRTEILPRKIVLDLASGGFLGAPIPEKWGGAGLDPLEYGDLTEIFSRACTSTRTLLTVHTSLVGETLMVHGSKELKDRYLPRIASGESIACFALSEPRVGSDAAAVATRYQKDGDTYILKGTKRWISFADVADLFLIVANGDQGPCAFMVERSFGGIETTHITGMLGSRATHPAEIEMRDVIVPAKNRVAAEGAGFTFVASTALTAGRYSVAWGGVAIASEALDVMSVYALEREQFGQPIANHQLVRAMVADAWVSAAAARELAMKAGRSRAQRTGDAVIDTSVAKQYAAGAAFRNAADAVQILGGNGCWSGHSAERLFRDSKILEIIEGSKQIQQLIISDHALAAAGRKPKMGLYQ